MTTNETRAAEVIAEVFRPLVKGYADALGRDLAVQLDKEGLLAPDLPTVTVDDLDERPHVTIPGEHKARLRVNEHGVFHAVNAWSDPMNPAEARERAHALLALANHVEGDPDD